MSDEEERSESAQRDRVRRASWAETVAALRSAAQDGAALRSRGADVSRRTFLQLIGASAALAGSACFEGPREPILPYSRESPDIRPGLALRYATAMELGGYAVGLLVTCREGRPLKVEGNPDHPASLGASGVHEQASILDLYDPGRAQRVLRRGAPSSWTEFLEALARGDSAPRPAVPLRVLLEPTASPLRLALLERLQQARPGTQLHFHSPLQPSGAADAARALYGAPLEPLLDFARAAVVLAVDADFMDCGPFHVRHARDFAERRGAAGGLREGSRLYAIESSPSGTGSLADHRLERPAWMHAGLLAALLRELAPDWSADALASTPRVAAEAIPRAWLRALARDLRAHAGESIVVAGERQPALVHGLAHALNAALGNLGGSVQLLPRALRDAQGDRESLAALVAAMHRDEVGALLILGGNPAYAAPADLEFASALRRVPSSLYLGTHEDETAARAGWLLPERHYMESWGDARALDGTASIVQPLLAPLYEGASAAELLALLAGETRSLRELLVESWSRAGGGEAFSWEDALRQGVIAGTRAQPVDARPSAAGLAALAAQQQRSAPPQPAAIELVFRADARVLDGRFANNVWLQELPDPVTKLTWDNAAWLAPATAEALGVRDGDWLAIERAGRRIEIPALVVAGQAAGSIALHLGYGRRSGVPSAERVGFDVYPLWTSAAAYSAADASAQRIERAPHRLARTQQHFQLDARQAVVVRIETLSGAAFSARTPAQEPLSLYSPVEYDAPEQWAMAIDLSRCSGCSACVLACQAENNVPVVGKEDVLRGREMHWLRIDRYEFPASAPGVGGEPRVVSQPMLCQHCEKAPCEYVCPVAATTHSPDGLNEMVYNRCIGTRFCSNNCPYKVRRFNWFDYNQDPPETRRMQFNPEVTVRARGVIEKCTYCVQRIRGAQRSAKNEGRALGRDEVVTACAQACPTRAIVFGSQADPGSAVSRALRDPRSYSALGSLGTQPRTRYLARAVNPSPELSSTEQSGAEESG